MAILRIPRSQIPGSRFNPTELELINYLRRRIDRNKKSRYITDLNVYEKEPWLLQHVIHPKFKKNVWFYFVTRKRPAKIKNPNSKRTSRVVGSCRWKTTGLLTDLRDEDGVKVGTMQSIVFKAKIEGKKDEINTGWVMHEFLLDKTGFQEVVLCRIEFKHENKNALYAPRLEPIVIGEADLVENKEKKEEDFLSLTDLESLGISMDLPKHPMSFQEPWFGPCSSETVPNLTAMGQESSYLVNGGIEQHQDFGYCSYQQQNQTLGHFSSMEPQQSYGQGFGGVAHAYQNQYLGQGTNPWQVSMMNQDMAIMTRGMMVHQQEQCLAAQYQQLSMNRGMEQHQDFGSCGQFVGESLGQQQNQFLGQQVTNLSPLGQQQWNVYSGPYLAQPYDQGIVPVTHQDLNSSYLCLAQDLGQNNDLSVVPMETQQAGMEPQQHDSSCFNHNVVEDLATQRQHLGQESNLSLTQQQNQILGHLSPMEQQQNMNQALEEQHYGQVVPESAQLDLGQTIDLPKETQQQDNVVENLPTQLHLETNQETVLPINQGINEPHGDHCSSSTLNESNQQSFDDETALTDQELDSMMDNLRNEEWAKKLGVNTPEEEAELTASLRNCNTYQSLLNYFCPI
ncbi:hypothetical protein AALP_AA6G021300 [Arabis alpina]|uniref:NAC domain-containing protein n=1 Tax=Arabis alpina TaxID=50452 RepID=A0A087GLJ1_ARAAL|nr:hypothetical protein AALP_AA6G021300 [Arabis alpina]